MRAHTNGYPLDRYKHCTPFTVVALPGPNEIDKERKRNKEKEKEKERVHEQHPAKSMGCDGMRWDAMRCESPYPTRK
ncbi:hypothetical protein M0804_003726 [Polistes exclamans]|nr:hypothetical protein M0804_003726 [Polistes exclamans]